MNIYKIALITSLFTGFCVNAQSTAGKTLIAKGKVTAKTDAASRNLKRRSIIFDNDVIATGLNSKAQLRMLDGGMIALKENSELQISDYKFSDENGRGSVVMELVKGGLRSVTGAIKAENGDYNLKTPTGSIGIRGTHYEVELIDGDMFVAVWDGAIDITVNTPGSEGTVSFGKDESYSFGVVSQTGQVTPLLDAPENFNDGHSTDESEEEGSNDEGSDNDSSLITAETNDNESIEEPEDTVEDIAQSEQTDLVADSVAEDFQQEEDDESFLSSDDFNSVDASSTEELLSQRSGSFEYNSVQDFQVNTNDGSVSNFSMSMNIDFSNATIPEGQLSFNDAGGEWFAAFNGIISEDQLNLDISFASHGNNLADGDISASFFDGLDSIIGEFDLYEVRNPINKVDGSFLLK
jgi:hypothetical protein